MSSLKHSLSSGKLAIKANPLCCSLFPKIVEIQALMKYYDVNHDGSLSYEEFIKVLRDPLKERRGGIVEKAWASLD